MSPESRFLSVPASNGARMLVNLDTVFEVAEAEGGSAFMFTNGSVLMVRDDFEAVALAIGHEGCLDCAPPREQLPLVPYQVSETEPPKHPWRTFRAMHGARP